MHPLAATLTEEAFYQAKEVEVKLNNRYWTDEERINGRQCNCMMSEDSSHNFIKYFEAIGYQVVFFDSPVKDYYLMAKFIPIIEI